MLQNNRPNNQNLGQNQTPLFNQNAQNNNFGLGQNPCHNIQNLQDPKQINNIIKHVLNRHGFKVGFYSQPYFVSLLLITFYKLNYQGDIKYFNSINFSEK